MSLRQELLLDGQEGIHVVTILPATIDTPLFQHGANYTNRKIVAPPPVYPADEVVAAVFEAIRDPKPEIHAGRPAHGASLVMKLMPGTTERLATELVDGQEVEGSTVPSTSGNLFEPSHDDGHISGGWRAGNGSPWPRRLATLGAALAAIPLARKAAGRFRRACRERKPQALARSATMVAATVRASIGEDCVPWRPLAARPDHPGRGPNRPSSSTPPSAATNRRWRSRRTARKSPTRSTRPGSTTSGASPPRGAFPDR
jgi:hypothetical protein